ncbi:phage minor head protein [Pasteurella multocida]|uniref:phage minor head protein n=1 Tax=Pasteurella multocida TaxID=747 RepID=UPI0023425C20|nr:phage minor head protein [Pasteurella multocida]MDC4238337.1 phage minor head protein [Pasteurella multocida]
MMMNLPEVMKGQKKPRIVRFKPIKQSRQTEIWYGRQLVSRVKWLKEQIERALQNKQSPFFMDNDFEVFNTEQLLSVIKKLSEKDRSNEIESLASEFVSRGNVQNQREVGENLKRQTGLDLQAFLNQNTTVLNKMSVMTTANVQLIKSIEQQYLDKVQTIITQGAISGKLNRDLAKEIRDLGGVTENRAKFIARDQSSKINAALTQARHEELGIKKYRWSTSGDERVRDSHAENDGKIFSYDDPPETGHPGHDFNCRCVAIPLLDDSQKSQPEEKPKGYISGKMDLGELFDESITGSGNKLFSNFGKVSSELIALAKESIGMDITEWQHSIDESSIRHILKKHGNEKAENNRGQRAVTKADILKLPLIISSFDSIEYAGTTEAGNESFIIKKIIDDEIFTVQEIRKKNRKVAVKTMWIRKKKKS